MGLDEIGNLPPFGVIRNGHFSLLSTERCHWAQLCEAESVLGGFKTPTISCCIESEC